MVVFVVHSAAGAGSAPHRTLAAIRSIPSAACPRRGLPPPRSLPAHEVTQAGGTAPAPAVATAATPGTEVCWPWAT